MRFRSVREKSLPILNRHFVVSDRALRGWLIKSDLLIRLVGSKVYFHDFVVKVYQEFWRRFSRRRNKQVPVIVIELYMVLLLRQKIKFPIHVHLLNEVSNLSNSVVSGINQFD